SVVDLATRRVKTTVPVGNGPRKIAIQPSSVAAAPAAALSVSIDKFAFSPASTMASVGQPVTFTNNDAVTHTSTSANWDSGELAPGASYTFTPQQPGTFPYHCTVHPFMTASLIVQ